MKRPRRCRQGPFFVIRADQSIIGRRLSIEAFASP